MTQMIDAPTQAENESFLERMLKRMIVFKFEQKRMIREETERLADSLATKLERFGSHPKLRKAVGYTCYALPLITGVGCGLAADSVEEAWRIGVASALYSAPGSYILGRLILKGVDSLDSNQR